MKNLVKKDNKWVVKEGFVKATELYNKLAEVGKGLKAETLEAIGYNVMKTLVQVAFSNQFMGYVPDNQKSIVSDIIETIRTATKQGWRPGQNIQARQLLKEYYGYQATLLLAM